MDATVLQMGWWILALCVSIYVLVRGADTFIVGAKNIGTAMGMSPFVTGVVIAGFGTSFPELASSLSAVFKGSTEIVIANVVGSNITNILLVVGLTVLLTGRVLIKRDLIKSELPIFFISTVHFVAVAYDGVIDRIEALLLIATFCAYIWYLFAETDPEDMIIEEVRNKKATIDRESIAFVVIGLVAVLAGAHYSIEMVVNIATGLSLPLGLVSITAIAIGTSLPELFVSLKAAKDGHAEFAIGTIFGSNSFNILLVIGLPALVAPLIADAVVMDLGIAVMVAASLIFFVNGLARQIMRWEGLMMVIFFCYFLVKLLSFI